MEWVHDNSRGVSIALPVNPISFYDEEWLDFASGADWSFVIPGRQTSTQVEGYYWGPMVSDLIFKNNSEDEDEPLPPDLLPMLIENRFDITIIKK